MTFPAEPQINMPETAAAGETIEIETIIAHPMESGMRMDERNDEPIPRNIIEEFTVRFNDDEVFRAKLYPAISANPYIAFPVRVEESGEFAFTWRDGKGQTWEVRRSIAVS